MVRADYETGNQRNQRISYEMHSQWNQSIISRGFHDNVSVNSKPDHPPGQPTKIRTFSLPGGGGGGILNQTNFYSFQRQVQELLDLFQRNWRQFEKQVFLCFFMSPFAKTVDVYCIFHNIDHFGHLGHFDKIFRLFKSHFCEC